MIDADLDHDEQTQPGDHVRPRFPVVAPERLAELAALCQSSPHGWHLTTAGTAELAELVRLYRGVTSVAESFESIGRIGEALEHQVNAAELVAESVLRGANARFQILARWERTISGVQADGLSWHLTQAGMRWTGNFDEALEIVRSKYGPKRGIEAHIVVRPRLDELEPEVGA